MADQNKYGIGIVGCGTISGVHAEAIEQTQKGKLVSAFSRNESNLKKICDKYGVKGYSNWDEFISDKQLDVVSICTPSGTHLDYGKLAAEAGKHVIVEKPIEVSLERANELIETCKKNDVKLAVIYQNRYLDDVQKIKSIIDENKPGKIFMADAFIKWFRSQEYYDSGEWRGTLSLDGGGVLINQAIHTVDLLLWLAGDVESVYAHTGTITHERIEGEDNAIALLKYKNGAAGVIEASTSVVPTMQRKIEIHGSSGTAILEGDNFIFSSNDEATGSKDSSTNSGGSSPLAGFSIEPHKKQFDAILDAIENNNQPPVSGEESLKSLALVKAVYESSRKNSEVKIDEFLKQKIKS